MTTFIHIDLPNSRIDGIQLPDTERVRAADAYAAEIHAGDLRKGRETPYIEHPRTVALHVARHGGTEDEVIAALLHDTVEDGGGEQVATVIAERFGRTVAHVVLELSDSTVDTTTGAGKEPWLVRKRRYAETLSHKTELAALVKAADILANLSDSLEDHREVGDELWDRFLQETDHDRPTRRDMSLRCHRLMLEGLRERGFERTAAILDELEEVLTALERESGAYDGGAPPELF